MKWSSIAAKGAGGNGIVMSEMTAGGGIRGGGWGIAKGGTGDRGITKGTKGRERKDNWITPAAEVREIAEEQRGMISRFGKTGRRIQSGAGALRSNALVDHTSQTGESRDV